MGIKWQQLVRSVVNISFVCKGKVTPRLITVCAVCTEHTRVAADHVS